MSDEGRLPAWAEELEHRIITEMSRALHDLRGGLGAEIAELRTDMNKRFDEIRDDITVNMARADRAHDRVDSTQAEVSGLRTELSHLHKRIREVEHRLDDDDRGDGRGRGS